MEEKENYLNGVVVKIVPFGAFVKTENGKVGLIHISKLSEGYVKDINSVIKEGESVVVKVLGKNKDGKLNLAMKSPLKKEETTQNENEDKPLKTEFIKKEKQDISPFDLMMKKFLQDSQDWQSVKKKRTERKL